MSLERCLIKHHDALKNPEKQEIRAAKEAYMKQGMNAHDASVKALRDEIARLEGSRKSVIEQANDQWKSIDPETHTAAKPSKADLKERAINDVIYNAIEDGASPQEILSHVASHTRKTDLLKSMLAKYLIKHVDGVEIKIGTLEQRKNLKFSKNTPNMGKDNEKVGAVYNHLSHRVLLFGNPAEHNIVDLMLHELTHAATMSALINNTESAKRMKELYELAKKHLPQEDWYGMTDVDEFVAEAFANRNFQEALQEVKYLGKSIFTRFVEAVRSALGLPSRFQGTLFDHVMATSEGLINENTELNKPTSAWSEARKQILDERSKAAPSKKVDEKRSSTKNIAKSLEDNGSSSAAASNGNDQSKSPDELRPVQTGGGRGGNGNIQTPSGPSGQVPNPLGSERVFGKASSLLEGNTNVIDALGHLRRGKIYAQFLNDLKDNYGKLLVDENGKSYLGHYVDKLHNMAATANELLKKGGNIAEKWSELRGEKKALNELAADATTSEIHPDLPLDMQDHQASNGRTISNKHLANDDGTFPKEVIAEHERLASEWAKLTDKARKVYKDARDHMADNWNKREALLNKRINEIYDPLIKDAERLGNKAKVDELNKERTDFIEEHGKVLGRVKGPYFPLSRFGKYYVVHKSEVYIAAEAKAAQASERLRDLYAQYDIPVGTRKELEAIKQEGGNLKRVGDLAPEVKAEFKDARWAVREANKALDALVADGTHYSNEAFESEGKATLRAKELGTKVMLKDDYIRKMSPVTETFMNRISKVIEGSLPEKQALAAREAIMQVWIQSLPDTSAMRSQLKRRKVEGYSRDMLRAFSKNAQADAHYLSRLEHMNELASDLLGMKDASKKSDSLMAKEVYDDVARRHVENMQFVDTPIANMLSGMSFVWQLGISPAFLLTNLSQPWMISLPFMAGRHGGFQSSNALAKAMAQVGKAAATSFKESKSMFFEIDKSKFSKSEQEMLDRAQKQGLLDITLEYDLSAMSKGETNRATQTMRAISSVPHQVEVINRVMTALASFRLELRKTGSVEEATQYAMRVLDKTHVDYSSINAPSYLKPGFMGGLGKIFFQYRKYQLGMLSLLANQWKQATNGSKEARNALIGLFAMHGAMAGALGLPLAGSAIFIANMINKIFGNDDEPWDAEVAFRNWLADAFGIEAGAVAAKGLPMLAGLDVSRRIGLGAVAAPIQVVRGNKKGRDLWLEMLASAAGPTLGGLAPNMADGVNLVGQGDTLKGMEKMLPTSIASLIKSYRISEEGVTTSRGAVAIKPDRIDAWDSTLQALGMTPSIVSERGDAVGAVENVRTDLKARSGQLEKAWVDARVKGDQEAVAEAKQAIDNYNAIRREKGEPVIRPADLLNAYKMRKNAEKNTTEQGFRVNKREKALGQYGRFADVS